MPRVFIPEPAQHKYETVDRAELFGTLTALRETRTYNPFHPKVYQQVIDDLERVKFDPKRDYLCITGKLVPCSLMLAAAIAQYGCVRVLVYSSREGVYEECLYGPT
jgi:hypothetical protein